MDASGQARHIPCIRQVEHFAGFEAARIPTRKQNRRRQSDWLLPVLDQ